MATTKIRKEQTNVVIKCLVHGNSASVAIPANSTRYVGTWASTIDYTSFIPVLCAGTIKNLYVYLDGAPGVGQSYTCTMRKNGSDQTVVATISGSGTNTGNDTIHTFDVAAGDGFGLKVVTSATAAPYAVQWSCEFDPS